MAWLSATNHIEQLNLLNSTSQHIKIVPVSGVDGGWLVSDDALPYLDDYFAHYKDWYLSLSPTHEFPAPRIRNKRR